MTETHPLLHEKIRLAVLLFLVSEFIFFVFLIVAYVYSQPAETTGPNAHTKPYSMEDRRLTPGLLLLSSITIYLAERALDGDRKRVLRPG